ncbi:ABC transporter ATP-binding protein [Paenibacillus sp. J5C_2022]|uniref:ABC transporter ATP-binding protein n=1 Tax=Paenibacillus sp. J5C2022 TaxID=2977129 RepID=UPI0021D10989|nr:ABC transporter ATP-binding protein [Paenibacillus sp. J5C2022]MCU6707533.1 ABC transporter ATP-binding protein [Paenibacillus sp. J5C2022]
MNAASRPCLEVRDVTRSFGNKEVIHTTSLRIEQREIFGLLGPSGSGKTTLVKMMAGIDAPTSGEIRMLHTQLPQLAMMNKIGYMAQSDALYMELTAKENLEFFGALFALRGKKLKERIDYVMSLVGLGDHLNQPVSDYSGGMKRRLSLGIALLHDPEVLILDEPTVGIDPLLRQSIWRELDSLSTAGRTIIVTTHVMDEAERCHRLGLIREGRLIAAGSPDDLKSLTGKTSIEEAFLYFGGVDA